MIKIEDRELEATLTIPDNESNGIVIFVHGNRSTCFSPRNEYLANIFHKSKLSTLLVNLLFGTEMESDNSIWKYKNNVNLMSKRLYGITEAVSENPATRSFKIGYYSSSLGTAAAVRCASKMPDKISTVVSRSGRVDLADSHSIRKMRSPILLLVGSKDIPILMASNKFMQKLSKDLTRNIIIIPGAYHDFGEPGKLEQIARIASGWFSKELLNH